MSKNNSQKFIGRNRPPRVQLELDLETYGGKPNEEIPFIMGVLSDLSGKSLKPLADLADRKFTDVTSATFDKYLSSQQPRAAFNVANKLTGEGNLPVELIFDKLEDFSPDKIAEKVAGLSDVYKARQQLKNLLSYMDGKAGAENLITQVMNDPALLATLAAQAKPKDDINSVSDQAE